MELWLLIACATGAFLFTFICSYTFTSYYTDPRENTKCLPFGSAVAISLSLCCCLLIPLDVYSVSSGLDSNGQHTNSDLVHSTGELLFVTYYGLYFAMFFFSFFCLPFMYFFFEEETASGSGKARACAALKYTLAFVLVWIVILVAGFFLRSHAEDGPDWFQYKDFLALDAMVSFTVGCLCLVGIFGWVFYSGYGLVSMPASVCRNRKTAKEATKLDVQGLLKNSRVSESDLEHKLALVQDEQKYIKMGYREAPVSSWKTEDRKKYNTLRNEERKIRQLQSSQSLESTQLSKAGNSKVCGCLVKCWNCLKPIRVLVGSLLFLVSLLVVVAIILNAVDKFLHSDASRGFSLDKAEIINPLDFAFKLLSEVFPLDFIIFGCLVLYIFVSSINGLVGLGVRLLGYKLYDVQPRKTWPHAMVMGSWLLMFLCLVVNIEVVSIMPQYATFGNQVYPFGLIHNSSTPTNTSSVSASVSEFPSSTVPTSENVVTEDSSIWRSTAVRNYLPEGEYKTLHESNSSDDTNLKPCSQTAVSKLKALSKLKKINLDRKYCVMTQVGLFVHQLEIQLPFFGVAIFFANLGFCLVFLISCVCVTVCRNSSAGEGSKDDIWGDDY